jgi:two-component system, chemotaxis family, chemotaxis protein CheY
MNRFGVNYRSMRALVALSNKQLAEYVWHFLKDNGAENVQIVHNSKDALSRLRDFEFTHFFVGHHLEECGGPDFARFVRMSDGAVGEAPIILIMSNPDREKVIDSRDSGVSEIMSIPFTGRQLEERLGHINTKPKEFIRTTSFIGPNRRRVKAGGYSGPERRKDIRVAHLQKANASKAIAG